MAPEAWLVLVVLVLLVGALIRGIAAPSGILLGGLVALVVLGVLAPERAFVGFSNPATITIAGLFVIAQVIRDHLGIERWLAQLLDVDGHGIRAVLLRLLPPVTLLSGMVSNTPIVATTAPIVRAWGERHGLATSRLLIPLSFATILGGTLTTIGTSTNLVVSGALEAAGRAPLGFFTVGAIGAPTAVIGVAVIVILAPRLLPDRPGPHEQLVGHEPDDALRPRVAPSGPLDRQTVASAGLRDLPTTYPASLVGDVRTRAPYRALTLATVLGMVAVAATGLLPMVTAVLLACAVLVASGAIRFRRAVGSLDLDVLLIVAAAIGLGLAVEDSGLAGVLGRGIADTASAQGPLLGLTMIVVGTLVLTELITNVAAAALVVPIALDVADRVGADPRGFAVAVALAASASFLTPIGYQTNTIVHGLGGYRFGDYWRLGLPLAGAVIITCLVVVPVVWP